MNNKTRPTIKAIEQRLNYLVQMATDEEISNTIDAKRMEIAEIEVKIANQNLLIEKYTPNEADYNEARSPYQFSLATRQAELNRLQTKLENLNLKIAEYNQELENIIHDEDVLTRDQKDAMQLVNILDEFKSRRELKTYAEDNEEETKTITEKLTTLRNRKKNIKNSINALSEQRNDTLNEIAKKEVEIKQFKNEMQKELDETPIIKNKKINLQQAQIEKSKLIARKEELMNMPDYLAYEINNMILDHDNYEEIKSKIEKLVEITRSKPYMNIVIRGGDTSNLQKEYSSLINEKKALEKEIKSTKYVIKNLPAEDYRVSDLERLVNLSTTQIENLKQMINNNQAAIVNLLRQHKDLQAGYKKTTNEVEEYLNDSKNLDEQSQTTMYVDYQQHQELLNQQKEIIAKYPLTVKRLMDANIALENDITALNLEIEKYKEEMKQIAHNKKHRQPIGDYIKRAAHEKEIKRIETNTNYLLKRLQYSNFNLTQLKNEILDGLKSLYAEELKANRKVNKKVTEEELEDKKIEVTPFEPKVTKEDLEKDVNALENLGDLLNKLDLKAEVQKKEKSSPVIEKTKKAEKLETKKNEISDLLNKLEIKIDEIKTSNVKEETMEEEKIPTISKDELLNSKIISEFDLNNLPENKSLEVNDIKKDEELTVPSINKADLLNSQISPDLDLNNLPVNDTLEDKKTNSLELNVQPKEEIPTVSKVKIKVIKVEPLIKEEKVSEAKEEGRRIKVVKVEPLVKEQTQQNNKIPEYNGIIFNPFVEDIPYTRAA